MEKKHLKVQQREKNKKTKIIIIALLILVVILLFWLFTGSKKYSLTEVFYGFRVTPDHNYLIHNGKLYYNVEEHDLDMALRTGNGLTQDTLNVMNLDESGNKILCDLTEGDYYITSKYFHFIRNNELYYSSYYSHSHKGSISNRKVNLSTCKITKLPSDYEFLKDYGGNEIAYLNKVVTTSKSSYSRIIKYNLDKNKILDENTISSDTYDYILDYSNFDIYYASGFSLYKNDELIVKMDNLYNLLLLTDKYMFMKDDYDRKIIQVDLVNNEVIGEKDNLYGKLHRISSDNDERFFQGSDRIYKYNEETGEFEDMLNTRVKSSYYDVYHYGKKLVFTDGDSSILIYDTVTKKVKEYPFVKYSIDSKYIYIVSSTGSTSDKTKIEKIKI